VIGTAATLWARGVVASLALAAATSLAEDAAFPGAEDDRLRASGIDVVLLTGPQATKVRIDVQLAGGELSAAASKAFEAIFNFSDADGDVKLSRAESQLLPAPQNLRQFAWGEFIPFPSRLNDFDAVDADRDGSISRTELTDHLRKSNIGRLQVAVSTSSEVHKLDQAFQSHLDRDQDSALSEAELRAAEELLSRLDADNDEVLTRTEIMAGLNPTPEAASKSADNSPPTFIIIPHDDANRSWMQAFFTARGAADAASLPCRLAGLSDETLRRLDLDQNEELSPDELAAWRSHPPEETWVIDLPWINEAPNDKAQFSKSVQSDNVRVELAVQEGMIGKRLPAFQKTLLERFRELDVDQDGSVSGDEARLPHKIDFPAVIAAADRDRDGNLSEKELTYWLVEQERLGSLHARLTIVDRGRNLFDVIDLNGDEVLSVRELRNASVSVSKLTGSTTDHFVPRDLTQRVRITVSRGVPTPVTDYATSSAPEWFQAMDRNRDGDLSSREFSGPPAAFQKLDQNSDGLIAPDEAR
jgi:Ca2+-binding EF-hand superfamily protein